MDNVFGPRCKHCAALLAALVTMLSIGVMGFPALLFAQAAGHATVTAEGGKAEMSKSKTTKAIRGDRAAKSGTKRQARRKEIPLRIPAGNAELLRLKSQPGLEQQGQPIVQPAR